jgi:hypothetical protein
MSVQAGNAGQGAENSFDAKATLALLITHKVLDSSGAILVMTEEE